MLQSTLQLTLQCCVLWPFASLFSFQRKSLTTFRMKALIVSESIEACGGKVVDKHIGTFFQQSASISILGNTTRTIDVLLPPFS